MAIILSSIVLAKNEAQNIEYCLKSLSFCDEIIVIDDFSTDNTAKIVTSLGAFVYQHHLNNDFSSQRNFGLSKAKCQWVLFVDADEEISDTLKEEIQAVVLNDTYSGFFLKRKDFFLGKDLKYGETASVKLLRLAKKEGGVWKGKVHEKWKVKGEIGALQNPIIHKSHKTLTEFLQEIDYYTSIRAQELYEEKIKIYWYSTIIYPVAKLLVNIFIKKGYKDGTVGFIFAMCMSFHSFLVRGKLWLKWNDLHE